MIVLFLIGFPFLAAVAAALWEKRRALVAGTATAVEFAVALVGVSLVLRGASLASGLPGVCGLGLYFTLDGFRALYVALAAFAWMVGTCFSPEYMRKYGNQGRYYASVLFTLGATAGCFFAEDLFTLFVFFEMMSFASYVWVAQDERDSSLRAAGTYLAVSVIGGMVLLMGLFLVAHDAGTLRIDQLAEAAGGMKTSRKWAAGLCMLFGFGAKAGAFPLHIWLPKAHPAAPAPTSALLSGILTKAGILGIMVLSLWMFREDGAWGDLVLLIGVATMVLGAVLALLSVNLKRVLACSSISQIGFILVGIGTAVGLGEENDLAVKGTLLHMMNHSLIKLALFCAAGVVFMNLHKLALDEVRGFGRKKPWLAAVFFVGAWSMAGLPLGSGYASKTLLHEALLELIKARGEIAFLGGAVPAGASALGAAGFLGAGALRLAEVLFLVSGGLTFAYMAKLFVALFLEKNRDGEAQEAFDAKTRYVNGLSRGMLTASAVALAAWGLWPGVLMDRAANLARGFLGHGADLACIPYYSWTNLRGALISLLIGIVVYGLVVRKGLMKEGSYVDRLPGWLDLEDGVYRPLLKLLELVLAVPLRFLDGLTDGIVVFLRKTILCDSPIPHELEEGTYLTHVAGSAADRLKKLLEPLDAREPKEEASVEHRLALFMTRLNENNHIIGRSLSFGLLMFCTGLLLTLIYLLL